MIEVFFHNIWEHAESGNASYILLDCNHQEGSERMNWIQGIQRAIDYVEANITEEIDFEGKTGVFVFVSFSESLRYFVRIFAW